VTLLKNKILERIFIPMREARIGLGETHNEGIHIAWPSRNIVRRVNARIRGASIRYMKKVCTLSKNKERHNLQDLFHDRILL